MSSLSSSSVNATKLASGLYPAVVIVGDRVFLGTDYFSTRGNPENKVGVVEIDLNGQELSHASVSQQIFTTTHENHSLLHQKY